MTMTRKDWTLAGSVALNLFLAGALLPPLLAGPEPPHFRPDPEAMAQRISKGLPPADAEVLQTVLRPRDGFRELGGLMEENIRATSAALTAEPFDPAALRAALDRGTQERVRFEQRQHEAMVEAAARLSPEGRRRLAELPFLLGPRRSPPPPGAAGPGRFGPGEAPPPPEGAPGH
ncbi:periplasmic heavy metal sensor [Rhodospirillum centenum]|uniref:Periplasmic heavy metal sensor n=1 Tax=Rhodospirillum centenum (strain ATCC 51521 / SW) TaxID=414684 RepID=B6IY70_RHOCS|nr:periplasmic heavy metal sensor [Rhodospirillum centenum]ACJ01244.1 conserved hypothetical protein [Rhodospirillum centenum SW]